MFRLVIAEARHLIQQRDTIERLAGELLGKHADFRRLQQVPGIGGPGVIGDALHIGDAPAFAVHALGFRKGAAAGQPGGALVDEGVDPLSHGTFAINGSCGGAARRLGSPPDVLR